MTRDVKAALNELRQAAREKRNVIEPMLECVRAYCHALRDPPRAGRRLRRVQGTDLLLMPRYRAIFLDAGGTLIHLDRGFILGDPGRTGHSTRMRPRFSLRTRRRAKRRSAAIRTGEVLDDASSWRIYAARLLELLEATGDAAQAISAKVRERHRQGTLWITRGARYR